MPQNFIKFFGNDWRSDPELRLCEPVSRAVWIDLLTFMMEAEPFGHLLINGKVPTVEMIGALTVTPPKVVKRALADLEENGVFSKTDQGVIYSRRMLKDAAKTAEMSSRGKQGGNPSLVKPELKQELKQEDNQSALLRARSPEARSQKPEARAGAGPSTNGHPANGIIPASNLPAESDIEKEAQSFNHAFFAIREIEFGGPPEPESYPPKDLSVARGWIERGVEFYPFRELIEQQMRRMAKANKPPPSSLWFFNRSVDEAIASDWQGYRE